MKCGYDAMGGTVVAQVVCLLCLAAGQAIPPGMAEPLTKMAERMAKVPHTAGVEDKLRAQAKGGLAGTFIQYVQLCLLCYMFLPDPQRTWILSRRGNDGSMTLHVEERTDTLCSVVLWGGGGGVVSLLGRCSPLWFNGVYLVF